MIERLRQFEANTKYEREQELYDLCQKCEQQHQEQHQQQQHKDTERLRQEYLSSVQRVQGESERKIKSVNEHADEIEKTLKRAEKKLSSLQNGLQELNYAKLALEQQDQAISLLQERF